MRLAVRILRRAQADLLELDRYLETEAPLARHRAITGLLDALDKLGDLPELGPLARDPRLKALGFRSLLKRPHVIFYKVLRQQIRVYRVLHQRHSWRRLL